MTALQERTQESTVIWPAHETGLRAYRRISNEKIGAIDPPRPQVSQFDEIEARISDAFDRRQFAVNEVRKSFVFREDSAITLFLSSHRTIPHLLIESLPHLTEFFGNNTVFALKILTEEDGAREMYAVVMWPHPAREAMKALDGFMENWWIERSGAGSGLLHFTYELE